MEETLSYNVYRPLKVHQKYPVYVFKNKMWKMYVIESYRLNDLYHSLDIQIWFKPNTIHNLVTA